MDQAILHGKPFGIPLVLSAFKPHISVKSDDLIGMKIQHPMQSMN
jgi:hypothetical protein